MELTGSENIYLNASILGLSKKRLLRKFDRIVEFFRAGQFYICAFKELFLRNGGPARVFNSCEVESEALIVDEVLSVGDEGFRKKCQGRIDAVMKNGVTLLFVPTQ